MKKTLLLFALALCLLLPASAKKLTGISAGAAVQQGLVRIEPVAESGAVLFYVVNGKKLYPALETTGRGESNYISVYDGTRERRLNKTGGAAYRFEVDDDSLTEYFTVKGFLEVKAVYKIAKDSESDDKANSILVNYTLKNFSGAKKTFVVKAVFNCRLGENRPFHFSSAKKTEINSEYVARPSPDESWIVSSDSVNAIEFIIYGKGITPPQRAVLANKDVAELSTPETPFSPGNSFDSLMSYNNSSAALFWPGAELEHGQEISYSYKINFSASDFQNSGRIYSESDAEKAASAEIAVQSGAAAAVAPEKKEEAPAQAAATVGDIDPSKLNAEYVQQLINHINSLEQSDPSLNRLKIQQLQTEVDEVLEVLRGRK